MRPESPRRAPFSPTDSALFVAGVACLIAADGALPIARAAVATRLQRASA